MIAEAGELVRRAAAYKKPGPYQLEAAIAACHAEAQNFAATDWAQIVVLYDMLLILAPSAVGRLNRAIAVWQLDGPEAALRALDQDAPALDGYHIFHATRGELLSELGRQDLARASRLRALELTCNQAERALLERRLFQ